jgi:hypothetical protein
MLITSRPTTAASRSASQLTGTCMFVGYMGRSTHAKRSSSPTWEPTSMASRSSTQLVEVTRARFVCRSLCQLQLHSHTLSFSYVISSFVSSIMSEAIRRCPGILSTHSPPPQPPQPPPLLHLWPASSLYPSTTQIAQQLRVFWLVILRLRLPLARSTSRTGMDYNRSLHQTTFTTACKPQQHLLRMRRRH